MEYPESLIISCDCGSVDRLGFDVVGRDILNIDHHKSNTMYGSINVVIDGYASASQVAYELFEPIYEISAEVATCFYTALFSDTLYFTTDLVDNKVFNIAKILVDKGVNPNEVAYHFTQRRSLASLRILQRVLASLTLCEEAQIAVLFASKEDILSSGAMISDMDGMVDYGRSLQTVQIAVFAMELEEGIRISLRSKKIDVSSIAIAFGGGGHKVASGFTIQSSSLEESIDKVLDKIKKMGLLNGI
jgi:phosphoesterase RecJ-like protein